MHRPGRCRTRGGMQLALSRAGVSALFRFRFWGVGLRFKGKEMLGLGSGRPGTGGPVPARRRAGGVGAA